MPEFTDPRLAVYGRSYKPRPQIGASVADAGGPIGADVQGGYGNMPIGGNAPGGGPVLPYGGVDSTVSDSGGFGSQPYGSNEGGPVLPGTGVENYAPQQSSQWQWWSNPAAETAGYSLTEDPGQMAVQDRLYALGMGRNIDVNLQNRIAQQGALENYYRTRGEEAYAPIAGGQGGYNPEEREGVLQQAAWRGLQYTPEQAQSLYLTPEEQRDIRGNTQQALQWFNPASMQENLNQQAAWTRGAQREGASNLRGTIGSTEAALRGAVDPNLMRMGGGTLSALSDREKLALSPEFLKNYQMTPEQVAAQVQKAGRDVANMYGGAEQRLKLAAEASGNTSPMAVAAARNRLMKDSAIASGETMANARLEAEREARNVAANREQMRLDAERGISGLALSGEQTRLGAESDLSRILSGNVQYAGGQRYGAENTIGSQAQANELALGDRAQDLSRYMGETGYGMWSAAEREAANRAAMLGQNRQQAALQGQNQQWQRGSTAAQNLSGNWANVGGARRADEQEYRGWLGGQQGQASQNVNTGMGQRIQTYGTQGQLMGEGTGNAMRYRLGMEQIKANKPGLFSKILGTAAGAAKGFLTGGWGGAAVGAIGGAAQQRW